ncbi:hypothetical protein BsWGS_26627 [Bradybaena similaris]
MSAFNNIHAEKNDNVTLNVRCTTRQDDSSDFSFNNDNIPESGDNEEIHWRKDDCLQMMFSWRWLIIILLHLSYFINMLPVSTMSMALVCMCGPVGAWSNDTLDNMSRTSRVFNTSVYEEYTHIENKTQSQMKSYEFSWDSETRGLLISGYLFTVFLVPQLTNIIRRYLGNKLTLTLFTATMALLNFIGPLAARAGVHVLLAARILTGLCINANVPISGDMLAWWLPEDEKLTSATVVVSGWIVGGSLGPLLAGYFCSVPFDNGWPLIFYFNGAVTVLWTICWHCLSSRKPETHRFISKKEKMYIVAHRLGMDRANAEKVDKPPYRAILTSRPCLAFLISGTCNLWALIIIFNCLPLYLTSVLQFSLVDTGILLSILAALRLPAMLLWSAFGNVLLTLKSMSVNSARKTMYMISSALAGSLCLATSFLDAQHKWIAVVLVIASVSAASCGTIMSSVIPLDMAPRYAGFLTGLSASLSCLVSITAPLFATGVTASGLYEEWRAVWITMAAVNFAAGFVFLVFGNASVQPWALSKTNNPANKSQEVESSGDLIKEDVSQVLVPCSHSK